MYWIYILSIFLFYISQLSHIHTLPHLHLHASTPPDLHVSGLRWKHSHTDNLQTSRASCCEAMRHHTSSLSSELKLVPVSSSHMSSVPMLLFPPRWKIDSDDERIREITSSGDRRITRVCRKNKSGMTCWNHRCDYSHFSQVDLMHRETLKLVFVLHWLYCFVIINCYYVITSVIQKGSAQKW